MPTTVFKLICCLFLFHFCFSDIEAQMAYGRDSEVGIWVGGAAYIGDINPDHNPKNTRPGGGLLYRYNLNPHMAFRGTIGFVRLKHEDALSKNPYQQARNLSFKSNVIEGAGQIELHFKKFIIGDPLNAITPYLTFGLGLVYFNPTAELEGETHQLQPLGTEGQNIEVVGFEQEPYSRISLMIPAGVGVKYWAKGAWNLFAELSYRHTFSDYLDDVSGTYVDDVLLGGNSTVTGALADRSGEVMDTGRIGTAGKQRGDKVTNDGYFLLNMGITYTLFNRKCLNPNR